MRLCTLASIPRACWRPGGVYCRVSGQTCRSSAHQNECIDRAKSHFSRCSARSSRLLRLECATRRPAPALLLVMLACAVFFWGLHYKLSIYSSGTAGCRAPAAKLLSQRERLVSSKDTGLSHPASPPPQSSAAGPALLVLSVLIGSRLAISLETWSVTTDDDSGQQGRANWFCFSPRPPPAQLPLS